MADITLDPLSVGLLAAVLALAVVHLVFLRKPEPPIHPLLLGRQSELARVRLSLEAQSTTSLGTDAFDPLGPETQRIARLPLGIGGIGWCRQAAAARRKLNLRGMAGKGSQDPAWSGRITKQRGCQGVRGTTSIRAMRETAHHQAGRSGR